MPLSVGLAKDQDGPPARPIGQKQVPPLHPTVVIAEYDKHLYPVIDVVGRTGQISLGGKKQPLPDTQRYEPMRAPAYLFGYIEFKDQEAVARTVGFGIATMQFCDFSAKLSSNQSYKDCYLAILCYDRSYVDGENDDGSAVVALRKIGDIEAGARKSVRVEFDYLDAQKRHYYFFPMVFSHGWEIQSNLSEDIAIFFRRLELRSHEKLMREYHREYQGADRQLEPYLRIQPVIPNGLRLDQPIDVDADFMVNDNGMVEDLRIAQPMKPEIELAVRRAVNGWLFFPRLVGGSAVSTRVRIPLEIQPTPARP